MAHLAGSLPMGQRYCSAMPALHMFSGSSIIPSVSPCCRSSFVVHPAWVTEPLIPQSCRWMSHCLPSSGLAWKRLSTSGSSVSLDSNVPVLVRGEQDGFYYRGTVKEEVESEPGMFLVEFAKPLVSHGRHPVHMQKTAKDDILEYANGMKHSLLPGDKVLAPWEPDMARYGPGTVLSGIETRDPLRASEDEEIMIQFWNDKKVKLQRDVALWIPPSLWERIVEMIHMPFTSRVKPRQNMGTNSCIFSCSPELALIPVCAVCSFAKCCLACPWFYYHCNPICCSPANVRCICCYHPRVDVWWPLPFRSPVFQRETKEAESSSKPSPHLLELEGPNQEGPAVVAAPSPASDSNWNLELFPTESTAVDSAVSTQSVWPEKPRLKDSARSEGKCWKRSHKSHPSSSGLSSYSSMCTRGRPDSKAISAGDVSHIAPTNQSVMFETIQQSPRGQLMMRGVLRDQDFKLSLGEEGFAASGKERDKRASKKAVSHECGATGTGDGKLDVTDGVRRRQTERHSKELTCNPAGRDMIRLKLKNA